MEQPRYKPPTFGGHITIVETVYHQRPGREPDACEIGFVKRIESGDPPVKREETVSKDCIVLDCHGTSMIVIDNVCVRVRSTNPTSAQLAKEKTAVVFVYCNDQPFASIEVGERLRFQPLRGQTYSINCRDSIANVEIHIYRE